MTPTSLDLQTKQSNPDFTTIPVVQLEKAATNKSGKKRIYMIIGAVVITLILSGVIFAAVAWNFHLFSKQKFDTQTKIDNRVIPEHVNVDFHNEIIFVSNERDGDIDKLSALHNYKRKLIAFKDLTNGRCYIDRLDETFEEGFKTWSGREGKDRVPPTRYFRYIHEPIDGDVLRVFAGKHVASHCADVPSHWIVDMDVKDIDNSESFRNKTVQFICGPRNICPLCPVSLPQRISQV